jgi:ribosomal protein S18 acetylase RimI-like enzyme
VTIRDLRLPIEMSIKIRPIHLDDLPFMREMLYQSIFADPPPPRGILDEPAFSHYVEGWGRAHDFGFVAMDAESSNRVGSVWIRLLTHDDPGWGYLDDNTPEVSTLAVMPERRGQGIGTALMQTLLDYADVRYTQVSLSCDPRNPAMRLYERLGFVFIGINGTSHTMVRKRSVPEC